MIKHEKFRYHDSNIFDIHEGILCRACYLGKYKLYKKMINLLGYERLNCKNKNIKNYLRNIFSDACYGENDDIISDILQNADIDVNFSLYHNHPVFQAFDQRLWIVLEHPKININIKYCDGQTILHCATWRCSQSDLTRLIKIPNIDINAQDHKITTYFQGDTPLHLACKNTYETAVPILLEHPDIDIFIKNNTVYII
ncbi:hypothetical protein TRFO_13392 [Tritrichomonas foetus]|uniref:Uncharacterized protein n=1 Tax=Tritrichomonas foetus TaxID=1144522 RepID=A0A1J4L2P6_9EUKA|nr:hypothetical protein TRFO_13392 [Tritrichomonas foetus]|eukprot:OHT16222.1 hypothetical protein TRFO_13392 [Tritrichomonas foetus]